MSEESLKKILEEARAHVPHDIERAGYGLETRVLAQVRAARAEGPEPSVLDDLGKWTWRCALGVAPVVASLVVWLAVWSGFSVEVFAYDAVGDLTVYLPVGLE